MRVFDQTKTVELHSYDASAGVLVADRIVTVHHAAVEAKEAVYDYIVKRYPNGGISRTPFIVTPAIDAQEAWDEYEEILVFVPYTQEELKEKRIAEIKERLGQLSEDFVQSWVGAAFSDLEDRKSEFIALHNELRTLMGKSPRTYY